MLLGAALFCFAHVGSLPAYYASCALFGLALAGVGDIPVGAIASRWVSERRGLALGFVYVSSNAEGSVVPLALGALASRARGGAPWPGSAPPPCSSSSPSRSSPCESLPAARRSRSRPLPFAPAGPGPSAASISTPRSAPRTFWVLAVVLFSFYLYYLAVNLHLVPYLTDIGWSDARAAASYSGAVAVGIGAKLGMGLAADRIPLRRALLANFAVLTLASLLLLAVRAPGILPIFLVAHGFATAAENVLLPLVVVECFGLGHMPRIYAR